MDVLNWITETDWFMFLVVAIGLAATSFAAVAIHEFVTAPEANRRSMKIFALVIVLLLGMAIAIWGIVTLEATACPNCGERVHAEYCPHCGSEVVDEAETCPNCGEPWDGQYCNICSAETGPEE